MSRRSNEGLKQKRSLGQVFLKVDWPVEKVCDRLKSWQVTRVLEIGPGGGVLTRGLLQAGFRVTAVEKDDRFVERLEDFMRSYQPSGRESLTIVNSDVTRFDLAEWLDSSGEPTAVVGNIPYNISSPILMWVLPYLHRLRGVELLVQLEFAQRLSATPSTKSYGSLSVYTQLRAKVELECKVDRVCFKPIPRVDSALVTLQPRAKLEDSKILKHVESVTRLAFQQRRKKIRNSISQLFHDKLVGECPIDLERRPDSFRPSEYVALAKYLYPAK